MIEVRQRIEIGGGIRPRIGEVPQRHFVRSAILCAAASAIVVEGDIVLRCAGDGQQAVEHRIGDRDARCGRRRILDEVQAELRVVVVPTFENRGDGIGADQAVGVGDIGRHGSLALLAAAALALLGAGAWPHVRAPDQIESSRSAAVYDGNGLAVGGGIARYAERLRFDPRIGDFADHGLIAGCE